MKAFILTGYSEPVGHQDVRNHLHVSDDISARRPDDYVE